MLAAPLLGQIFVGYDQDLLQMTVHGMRLFALSFLFSGFNIFGSAFFTALNNGLVSAVISFLRTLVFQCGSVVALPMVLELDGVWLSVAVAELVALVLTGILVAANRRAYHY